MKAQTTSERQANQSIELTANGCVNVIELRSTISRLNLYHTSEMEDVTMSTSEDRAIRLHRWREKKEQEDLQTYGKHRRVSTTQGGVLRAKKQKMASFPQARSCKGPATSISPSSFDTSLSTLFQSHRICSILTGPLLSLPRRSTTTRTPTCRAPRPPSTSPVLVLPPAPAILPTSLNGMHPIARPVRIAL